MKHKNSKIGEYGITWRKIEGYKHKNGKKVPPHLKPPNPDKPET